MIMTHRKVDEAMEQIITQLNERIHAIIWGPFMLVLIIGVGMYFTIRSGFFQLTHFKKAFCVVFKPEKTQDNKNTGMITSFEAATTSLAGCLGTGNIIGVATTLVAGGPGALFWMWVSSFFGMMTKYAEIVLAVHYKTHNAKGEVVGGPMYYIEKGMRLKWLAAVFAVCGALASFGIGNMTQVNAIADSLGHFESISSLGVGVVIALLVGFVIIGGIKRIASVSAVLIPVFAVAYTLGAIAVLCVNAQAIPSAFSLIMRDALDIKAVGGGIFGYTVMHAMRFGVARGVFSNEAGLGSASFAHAVTHNKNPVKEGMWGIFEVFVDTIVMCTLTGLVILTSGALESGADGAILTARAFSSLFAPSLSNVFLATSISFFAFATLISWSYYGEKCVEYLFKKHIAITIYKFLFLVCILLGATMKLELVWGISDTLNGAMAIPNLVALIALSGVVVGLTRQYKKQRLHQSADLTKR